MAGLEILLPITYKAKDRSAGPNRVIDCRTAYHNDIVIGNIPRICHLYPPATSSDTGYSCSRTRGKICEMPFLSWRLKVKTVNRLVDSCRKM